MYNVQIIHFQDSHPVLSLKNSSCPPPSLSYPCPLCGHPWTLQDPAWAHFFLDPTSASQLPCAEFHVPNLPLIAPNIPTKRSRFPTPLPWPVDTSWRVGIILRKWDSWPSLLCTALCMVIWDKRHLFYERAVEKYLDPMDWCSILTSVAKVTMW